MAASPALALALAEARVATLASANSHADAGDAATLASARTYTDTTATQTLTSANAYTDQQIAAFDAGMDEFRNEVDDRFHTQDRAMARIGAMGAAMSQMAMNTSGLSGENRLGIGLGSYSGQEAVSVGFQRGFSDNRASISIGGAFSGSESSVGVGAGFSW